MIGHQYSGNKQTISICFRDKIYQLTYAHFMQDVGVQQVCIVQPKSPFQNRIKILRLVHDYFVCSVSTN
jgi:hypothetical protein